MGGFDDGDGTFSIKRFGESQTEWLFQSDNPAYGPIRIARIDVSSHPILGIVLHNLSQDGPVRQSVKMSWEGGRGQLSGTTTPYWRSGNNGAHCALVAFDTPRGRWTLCL